MLKLSKEREQILINWLSGELELIRQEKEDIVEDWKTWQNQYWAQPSATVKNFPFQRAANVVVPLTAIAVEAVHARLMNTVFSVEPFWSIRPRSAQWLDVAKPVEEWLQTEVENVNALDVYAFCNDSFMELVKLGTGIGKSGYDKIIKKSLRPAADGSDDPFYSVVHNGATLEYTPCANFLIRAGENDPQTAPLVGEEHVFTWGQLKQMSQSGRMITKAVDRVKSWVESNETTVSGSAADYSDEIDKLEKFEPEWREEFRVAELCVSFDVDGVDGEDEEIIVDFHDASQTILSIRANWYTDLHRPWRVNQYVRVEGRIWGIGVGKQNEQFQDIITTINRQRLANATLANMRMLAVKKQSGVTADEPIFPGKIWFLDDPSRDAQVLQLSEVYPSAYANEQGLLNYSERRTGVNEVLLGIPQSGTPGTATGDLARIAEGNKRFDLVLRNIRRWLSLLGQDVLSNYQQFGDAQRHWLIKEEEGAFVEKVLSMPTELVRNGAVIELTATSSIVNRQVEQQQWMSLFQIISNYYGQIIQLAQLFQDPQLLASVAMRAVAASDEAMKRLLSTFDVPEAERLLFLEGGDDRSTGGGGGTPGADREGLGELLQNVGPERLVSILSGTTGVRGVLPPGRNVG
jgi:hypothetical protein